MKINLHCLSFFIFYSKIHKIPTYHWSKNNERGGEISLWNKCFHYFMLATLLAPIIATSFSQHNSFWVFSYNAWEFGEHLIIDQRPFSSYRISPDPQIHSSMLVLLLSSVHLTHLLQGSGQRTETAMVKILIFVLSDPFLCLFWVFVLDCCPGGRSKHAHYKISNRGSQVLIFFICWYLIESMMPCIWTRCSGPPAEKQAHNIKDPAVYLTVTWVLFYPCLY